MSDTDFPARHTIADTHSPGASGEQDSASAMIRPTPTSDAPMQASSVDGTTSTSPATLDAIPSGQTPVLVDSILFSLADALDDLERTRIANENRLRSLTRDVEDKDGEVRGLGLTEDHPTVKTFVSIVDALNSIEKRTTRALEKAVKQSPLGPWVAQQKGVGEKQFARLLATIGDPYMRPELENEDGTIEPERPRTVSELWQYCGHGDPLRSRKTRGQTVQYNPTAKMRVYLIAVSCMKTDGRYRKIYEARREVTADRLHARECVRCGPSGKPAQSGSPWSKGHQLADALRIVGKEMLRDLWITTRDLHSGQLLVDTQSNDARVD